MKFVLLVFIVLYVAVISYIVYMCLNLITRPNRYTYEQMRAAEIGNGFGSSVRKYEEEWKRKPFELSCNGVKISGEIIDNPKAVGNKTVIICHGQKVNRYCSLKYADIFMEMGYKVLIYDERYFGKSGGEISTLGQEEAKDLREVYVYA
nr:lysophospholipase [Erysipelotrichaceae bacterium]